MSEKSKTEVQVNGFEYASADEIPVDAKAADDRAVVEGPVLHHGARLAAKLNTKIIVNGAEFNNPGELSVELRELYHEALAAVFPPGIAVSVNGERKIRFKKVLSILAVLSVLAGAVYLWLRALFG